MKTQVASPPNLDAIPWTWPDVNVRVDAIKYQNHTYHVCRDDLLDPHVNGNKARKLDAVAAQWNHETHIITCGGLQSAHLAAVSALGARRRAHVHALIRGEKPALVAGNLARTLMFARHITYVDRDTYANREEMFARYSEPHMRVLPEGGATVEALYGLLRLVRGLRDVLGSSPRTLVVESGTGTTAWGLGLGITLLSLPWRVHAVGLFREHRRDDVTRAARLHEAWEARHGVTPVTCVDWVPGTPERRFGKVTAADVQECRDVACETGLLLDPIYTLTAWRHLKTLGPQGVMIHAGGVENLGAALIRWPQHAPG